MAAAYDLGIDLGTTNTTAALRRTSGGVEVIGLGATNDRIPTVVFLTEDGSVLVGEAAARQAATDPAGAVTDLKRRIGEANPLIVRRSPYAAEGLLAKLIAHVVTRVTEREGGPPRRTVITHPTTWDAFRVDLFKQALRRSNIDNCSLTTEAQAAAEAFAARNPVPQGGSVAVFDLGGRLFEASLLTHRDDRFEVVGSQSIPGLGGDWFDEAMLTLVKHRLGERFPTHQGDPALESGLRQLRRRCAEAKELLTLDESADVPVLLPSLQDTVTVHRAEFEQMVAAQVNRAVDALASVMAASGSAGNSLVAVVPVGGCTRMPIVLTALRARFGDKVVADFEASSAVARGAAIAAGRLGELSAPHPAPVTPSVPTVAVTPTVPTVAILPEAPPAPAEPAAAPVTAAQPSSTPPVPVAEPAPVGEHFSPSPSGSGSKRPLLIGVVIAAVLAAGIGAFVMLSGDDGEKVAATDDAGDGGTDEASDAGTGDGGEDGGVTEVSAASAIGMKAIPAGTYTLGAERPEPFGAETPLNDVELAAYSIDQYEVTNADYQAFIDQTGAEPPATWSGGVQPAGQEDHPVRGVTYDWATAYCASLDKRLPTEAEWEAAARGADSLIFPWGNEAGTVALPETGTYPVGSVGGNVSPFGVYDLVGNAWEWVADTYDDRIDPALEVLRGGQNGYIRKNTVRLPVDPLKSNAVNIAGFRCAASEVDDAIEPLVFGDYERPTTPASVEPDPLPEGVLVLETFQDPTSGWLEVSNDRGRFGYHPNEFYHLETKVGGEEVLAFSPTVVEPGQAVTISTAAVVEPNLTGPEGDFSFGLAFAFDNDDARPGLIFIANPRKQKWLLCQRKPGGGYDVLVDGTFNFADRVELEVRADGAGSYALFIGETQVTSRSVPELTGTATGFVLLSSSDSTKVHIHFDSFEIDVAS